MELGEKEFFLLLRYHLSFDFPNIVIKYSNICNVNIYSQRV
jgi:hypothetical protein